MADLFGRCVQQHVAIFGRRCAIAPSLKKVLHADPDFTFNAANGLLTYPGELGVWLLDNYRVWIGAESEPPPLSNATTCDI